MPAAVLRLQLAMPPSAASNTGPLAGRHVVVTRARAQAGALAAALEAAGARVSVAPAIRVEPVPDLAPLHAALRSLERYRWVLFASRNAVEITFDAARALGPGGAAWARVRTGAVGPATAAALRERGIEPAVVAERRVAEGLVEAVTAEEPLAGARVLVPQAADARPALAEGLRSAGAAVDAIPVYRTVAAEGGDAAALAGELLAGRVDAVTFTSSSTVRHFVELVGERVVTAPIVVAALGPITADAARDAGFADIVVADDATVPALVAALARRFA